MSPTNLIRFTQAVVLAAIVAALAPALALGNSNSGKAAPDWFERYAAAHPYGQSVPIDGRSPDTLDAALAASSQSYASPGFIERNDAAHFGSVTSTGPAPLVTDGRSPDTRDAADTAQLQVVDGRSPDTLDAAQTAQPIELVSSRGFDWSDAGIGAAMGAALILVMGTSLLILLRGHRRHHVQAT